MNKGELIDAVAGSAGLSRADATKAVDAVLDSVQGTLASGGSVSLVGFGTFSVKQDAIRVRVKRSRSRPAMCLDLRLVKA
jgi:DNA-binding protein HU-beta